MTHLTACIQGIGVLGPGIADWPAAAAILRGESAYVSAPTVLPAPGVLPPAERRRAGRIIKLALAIGAEAVSRAGADARELPTVFSSSGGDGDNCHEICVTLASSDRQLSPTRFHNSVHNAAAGYWGIAYGCTQPSTALCANDGSFSAGLLEATAQLASGAPAVLLIAYDADYPPPLRAKRNIPDAFGTALLLIPRHARSEGVRMQLDLSDAAPNRLEHAQLEALRVSIPAARSLPLLQSIARGANATVVLQYLSHLGLAVRVEA
jgi:hypothetical protein